MPNGNFAELEALQGNPCGSERSRTLRKPAANDSDQWMSEQLCKASGGRDWICGKKSKSRRSVGRCVPAFRGGSVSGADTHMGELQGVMLASEIPQYIVELGKLLEREKKTVTEIAECECFKELTEKFLVS